MTVVLVAVYVPIGFQGGLTGALFTEFAFTLVGAVTVSAIVALTLSPMMCSRLLKPRTRAGRGGWQDRLERFHRPQLSTACAARYERLLHGSLDYLPVTAVFAADRARQHLFPVQQRQDTSWRRRRIRASSSRIRRRRARTRRCSRAMLYSHASLPDLRRAIPKPNTSSRSTCPASRIAGMVLKPWDQRTRDAPTDLQPRAAAGVEQDRRRAQSRRSSRRRCRAASACRSSS